MSASKPIKEFRCPPLGTGGTFYYCNDVKPLGVIGHDDSLGIMFRIDSLRVFCASMQFNCSRDALPEEEGKKLRVQIFEKLKELSEAENWVINNGKFGRNVLVACQKYTEKTTKGEDAKYAAWYMLKGVHDFFTSCAMQVKGDITKLSEVHPGLARVIITPDKDQNRFHKLWLEMQGDVQLLCGQLRKTDLKRSKAGFVFDQDSVTGPLLHVIADGKAVFVTGFDAGKAAPCKYKAKKFSAEDIAIAEYNPNKVVPKLGTWSFSI